MSVISDIRAKRICVTFMLKEVFMKIRDDSATKVEMSCIGNIKGDENLHSMN